VTDVLREKYRRLFVVIQELELRSLNEELTAKRNELTRVSDGCGKPHPQN